MNKNKLYEEYHSLSKKQSRIIDGSNFTYRNIIQFLNDFVRHTKSLKILDVGCGVGTLDFYLSSRGDVVTGVDISKVAIQRAKQSSQIMGLENRTKFIVKDLLVGIPQKGFDLVICSEVLEHILNDKEIVRKIYEALNKDGYAFFSSPSSNAPIYRLGFAKKHDKEAGHLRRYNIVDYSNLIKNGGFKILKVEKNEGLLRNALFVFPLGKYIIRFANRFCLFSDLLSLLDKFLLPLGYSDIFILARKI